MEWLINNTREGDMLLKVDNYMSSIICGHYVSHVVLVLMKDTVKYVIDCTPDKFGGVNHVQIKTLQSFLFKGKQFYLRQLSGRSIDHTMLWQSVRKAVTQSYDIQVVTMQLNRALDYSFLPALPLNKASHSTTCSHMCLDILSECGVIRNTTRTPATYFHPSDLIIHKKFNLDDHMVSPFKYGRPVYISKKA
jgi:hypothetical protein